MIIILSGPSVILPYSYLSDIKVFYSVLIDCILGKSQDALRKKHQSNFASSRAETRTTKDETARNVGEFMYKYNRSYVPSTDTTCSQTKGCKNMLYTNAELLLQVKLTKEDQSIHLCCII